LPLGGTAKEKPLPLVVCSEPDRSCLALVFALGSGASYAAVRMVWYGTATQIRVEQGAPVA